MIPLVLIQGGLGAAGSADVPDFRLVFLLLTLHNPVNQTFLRVRCPSAAYVCADAELDLEIRIDDFESEVDLAMWMFAQPPPLKFHLVDYECKSLSVLSVISVLDITETLRTVSANIAVALDIDAIKRLAQFNHAVAGAPPRARLIRAHGRGRGRGRPTT